MSVATRRFAGTILFLGVLCAQGEGQARAAERTVAFEYSASPECPSMVEFQATVTERLGYDAFRKDAPDHVVVEISPRGHGFEGRIEWRDPTGQWVGDRTFSPHGEHCADLARAMAFALAIQIQFSPERASPDSGAPATSTDKEDTGKSASPPATPASVPKPEPPPPEVAPPTVTTPSRPFPRPVMAVGVGGLVAFGLSSKTTPFGRVFGTAAWPGVSIELGAEAGWPTTTRRGEGPGFTQQQVLGAVAACGHVGPGAACLVGKAGGVRIVGDDIDTARSAWGAVVEAGLRVAWMQSLGRHLFVTAKVEGLLNVTRWQVTLDQGLVWSAPRFAATLGLDGGVRFP
jgi:hypothetical protein